MINLRKKILVPTTLALLAMLFVSIVNAQVAIAPVTVRMDKRNYLPGEKGEIYVSFYNDANSPVSIHNITVIYYEWQAYIDDKWVGNKTIKVDLTAKEHGVKQLDPIDFVVPSDGRAGYCSVKILIGTTAGYESGNGEIYVTQTPHYMEQILTLFTVQVVLLIVCTIIIAATIFLSARRPQVTWKHEEK